MTRLDDFTRAYIEAALWSSTDDNDVPLDRDYSIADLAPETLERIRADCAKFQREQVEWLKDENLEYSNHDKDVSIQGGHDFWLTRNGHGAGFWDGDWSEPAASKLTDASKAYGSCDLYVGDDGRIYA